jgi:hypothetical protein
LEIVPRREATTHGRKTIELAISLPCNLLRALRLD